LETWTSTETGRPTAPVNVAAAIEASMSKNGRPLGARYPDVSVLDRFADRDGNGDPVVISDAA
jgi:hypothetical protein